MILRTKKRKCCRCGKETIVKLQISKDFRYILPVFILGCEHVTGIRIYNFDRIHQTAKIDLEIEWT